MRSRQSLTALKTNRLRLAAPESRFFAQRAAVLHYTPSVRRCSGPETRRWQPESPAFGCGYISPPCRCYARQGVVPDRWLCHNRVTCRHNAPDRQPKSFHPPFVSLLPTARDARHAQSLFTPAVAFGQFRKRQSFAGGHIKKPAVRRKILQGITEGLRVLLQYGESSPVHGHHAAALEQRTG